MAEQYPDIWMVYAARETAAAKCGPLAERELRLVKFTLAIGARSEETVHSDTRCAQSRGVVDTVLAQVAMLAIASLGLPHAVVAKT